MQGSVSLAMILCLCVLFSHRLRIVRRLFLVIIFLYLVSSKLFRLYLYIYFVFAVALGLFISSFIMLDSFTLLSRRVFN